MAKALFETIKNNEIRYVDLRFTDTKGKEQHISVPSSIVTADFLESGKMFDGSSIAGWKGIEKSDMILMPDPECFCQDPFTDEATLILRCNIIEPGTMKPYQRDPRSLATRAEAYLKETGIADACFVGPEPEFFILDDVRWNIDMKGASYSVDSDEASWNSSNDNKANLGHRPSVKGGYFPVPPVDSSQDIRSAMCTTLMNLGIEVEAHHHEVATGNQNEIATKYNTLCAKADELQLFKYVVHNVAHAYGKTATFMPKPLVGDNGSGMHCHISLMKDDKNLFAGNGYQQLSETALHFIGGILQHAKALNAFTNATTNSYKRLIPGFEAPVHLTYSGCNRSAAIRIPHTPIISKRIEIRFSDGATNPYLAFAAIMMAGIDGIQNKTHPGDPMDLDLYQLSESEAKEIPSVAFSLEEALTALEQDQDFLLKGDVFSKDLIDSYIQIKRAEVLRLHETTHPVEFDMYYSL